MLLLSKLSAGLRIGAGWCLAILVAVSLSACSEETRTPTAPAVGAAVNTAVVTITGTVRELLDQGPGNPVANVRLQVRYKAGAGPSATTDASGRYSISGVTEPYFELQATRAGFEPWSREFAIKADASIDVLMTPVRRAP